MTEYLKKVSRKEGKRKKKEPKLGAYVLTAEGRTGRWVDITREGQAVVVSGQDILLTEIHSLQLAFENDSREVVQGRTESE